jgi:hypothetical protein
MAIQTIVTCDVHGDGVTGGEPVTVGFDGAQYEVDLCQQHRDELTRFLAPYLAAARRSDQGAVPRASRRRASGSKRGARSGTAEVREWARSQGYELSDRGRVPAAIAAEFAQAHGGTKRNGRKGR